MHPDLRQRITAAGILSHAALEDVACVPARFRVEQLQTEATSQGKPSYQQLLERVRAGLLTATGVYSLMRGVCVPVSTVTGCSA